MADPRPHEGLELRLKPCSAILDSLVLSPKEKDSKLGLERQEDWSEPPVLWADLSHLIVPGGLLPKVRRGRGRR